MTIDKIYRGTTPTLKFTLKNVNPTNITAAYLTINQGDTIIEKGGPKVEKNLSAATRGADYIQWKLTQADTLSLSPHVVADYQLRFKVSGGDAYESDHFIAKVIDANKEGEI